MTAARYYFEDLSLGTVLDTPAITVTGAHAGLYAGLSGEDRGDPGLVPDLLPLCLSTGLGWRVPQPPLVILAFLGIDWQVQQPLRVGETIWSRARVALLRPMRDAGIVVEEREIVDQRGRVVQRGRFTFLVAKRPPKEEAR